MIKPQETIGRKLRLGMIGGGTGSFIGPVHRSAALMHGQFELVAGVLSSNEQRSLEMGAAVGLARAYANPDELFAGEKQHAEPIDLLAILTPNNSHYELSCRALDAGIDVLCEKPLTLHLDEAQALKEKVAETGQLYGVAYCYTGYPMVRQARAMMESGLLGDLRMVQCEYIQGHLAEFQESERDNWHMQPEVAGESLILGDIATHSYHLANFVTGSEPVALSADVTALVPGRVAHDYCGINTRYANGARGQLWVTQAAAGALHGLRLRVFGSKGGLEWQQEQPNELIYRPLDKPVQTLTRGAPGLSEAADRATHVAKGHPEGYHDAFANLYTDMAEHRIALIQGQQPEPLALWYPGIDEGVSGVNFMETALRSSQSDGRWEAL